ncbi:peroxidase family protein, partial [uncultured Sneathiella sp.]|uniref:peroxidase family protein n=1 Tax=uncultured Sneathiella sp. TaxID=879315 RepID=UPI0030D77E3F
MRVRNPFLDPRSNSRDRDDRSSRNEDRRRDPANENDRRDDEPRGSRNRDRDRDRDDRQPREDDLLDIPARPVDGTGTIEGNPDWGAAGQTLLRLGEANYADGISGMNDDLPGARDVSNAIAAQTEDEPNSFGVSDLFYVWGQFLDHDIDEIWRKVPTI